MTVLDASALLAWIYREDGHETVAEHLHNAVASAVNWSEVLQKINARGGDADQLGDRILALGLGICPVDGIDARTAAKMYPLACAAGLSLADRVCLAVAKRRDSPVLTADKAWESVAQAVGVDVCLIR